MRQRLNGMLCTSVAGCREGECRRRITDGSPNNPRRSASQTSQRESAELCGRSQVFVNSGRSGRSWVYEKARRDRAAAHRAQPASSGALEPLGDRRRRSGVAERLQTLGSTRQAPRARVGDVHWNRVGRRRRSDLASGSTTRADAPAVATPPPKRKRTAPSRVGDNLTLERREVHALVGIDVDPANRVGWPARKYRRPSESSGVRG